MSKKSQLQLLLIATLFGACLSTSYADQPKKASDTRTAKVQQMINDAEMARKKAAKVEGEWRDVGKFIKQAKKALAKGDYVTAMKLAAKAHKQSVLGYRQAISQRELKMPSYLKY